MEQIFFLVLVAVVGLLRWLSQAAEKKRNEEAARGTGQAPAGRETAVPRAPVQTEEERIRKFMEALGMPTSQAPQLTLRKTPPLAPSANPSRNPLAAP